MLAAEIEQVMGRLLNDPRAAWNRRELGFELDEIRTDEAREIVETLAQIRCTAHAADASESINDRDRSPCWSD
jgi:hypothetical protein